MGKKTDKLQRVVEKLATRYGEEDEDVRRLQSALDILNAGRQKLPSERRRYGPSETTFLTPAKKLYYASSAELPH